MSIITENTEGGRHVIRHSAAHIMAQAVLDLGTGSGAIACAIAWERRMAHVTGVDISADAVAVAEQNAAQLDLDNLRFVQGSWIEPVRDLRYAVVVSNPPYIAAGDPSPPAPRHRTLASSSLS